MAPEINEEKIAYAGPPVDIFAAGVCLFSMLTMKCPFRKSGDKFH
jgi:serine/threonine protein kinase